MRTMQKRGEVKRFSDADAARYLRGLSSDRRVIRMFRDSIRAIESEVRVTLMREFGPAKRSPRRRRRK
jgi:hypothetical protein